MLVDVPGFWLLLSSSMPHKHPLRVQCDQNEILFQEYHFSAPPLLSLLTSRD